MSFDEFADSPIQQELITRSRPRPPWLRFPLYQRRSIAWRMGSGETYMLAWHRYFDDLDPDERVSYLRSFQPIPMAWIDFVHWKLTSACPGTDLDTCRRELHEMGIDCDTIYGRICLDGWAMIPAEEEIATGQDMIHVPRIPASIVMMRSATFHGIEVISSCDLWSWQARLENLTIEITSLDDSGFWGGSPLSGWILPETLVKFWNHLSLPCTTALHDPECNLYSLESFAKITRVRITETREAND